MQSTAQAWLVYQLTGSPFALGFVTTLQFLPVMLFTLFGGVFVDRVPKRKLMMVTQTLLLLQAAVFGALVASGAVQIWHVYVLAVIQGLINAVDNPLRQALPAELVGRDQVGNAIALNSMLFNGARIAGPAMAGVVIAVIGIAPALFLNALSFIAVIAALTMMRPSEFHSQPSKTHRPPLRELREGLAYAWRAPAILTILMVLAVIGTFGYNFSTVIPLLGGFVLHVDASGFGALSTSLGIGSFVGAIVTVYTRKLTIRRLFAGSACFAALLAAVSLSHTFLVSAVLLACLGFAGIVFTTTANTLLQQAAPDDLRGRVTSLYVLLFVGITPIGAFYTGTLANAIGVAPTLVISAGICGAGLLAAALYWRAHRA
jgi:MFS family permease